MATRQTGQSLRQVARALEKVPDEAVKEAAEQTVDAARAKGGTFFAGKSRLGAKIKRTGKGAVSVLGTPPGAWAIKDKGRGVSLAHPGSVLGVKGGSFHSARARPTRGDHRWQRVRETAEDASPRVVATAVSKAIRA